jgi:hypothetical protein
VGLTRWTFAGVVLLASCDPVTKPTTVHVDGDPTPVDATPESAPDDSASTETVSPPPVPSAATLRRASLDLRGVLPSPDDYALVEANPDDYQVLVEQWLEDPRFGPRIRDLFAQIFLTRQDYYYVFASEYGLDNEVSFVASVGDEPLRIVSQIIEEDLPWNEVVTGDWTMADHNLAVAFPVDYPDGLTGWRPVRYTDGRPPAGVLATNSLWWRYPTNTSNLNRGRANAISRIFLCEDYLEKPITFDRDVDLLDEDSLRDALQNNPGCVACHATLDPLASYLFGFNYRQYDSLLDTTTYHPERERDWDDATGVAPGYYGTPGYSLADLGEQIAADSRFPRCLAEQVFGLYLARDAEVEDFDQVTAFRDVLISSGMRVKPLITAVLTSDEYVRGGPSDDEPHRRMVSADLLSSAITDLTGFRFTSDGYDILKSDTYGVRTAAGGVDGVFALEPATEPNTTILLVHERIAQAAADFVVDADLADPSTARLLTEVDGSELPDTHADVMARQVQVLHRRIFGTTIAADGPEVDAALDLWADLHALSGDKRVAWKGLVTVLLRDPSFLFY